MIMISSNLAKTPAFRSIDVFLFTKILEQGLSLKLMQLLLHGCTRFASLIDNTSELPTAVSFVMLQKFTRPRAPSFFHQS